jgi:hypothetical protein
MYFYHEGMTDEECADSMRYIVPMQHNFENPLNGDCARDTFIEYWISRDERLSQDYMDYGASENAVKKLAAIDLRFLGEEAETWAKAFHHITQREDTGGIFAEVCNGTLLEHIGDIRPVGGDYFGVGNSSIAFDLSFQIQYKESLKMRWKPLEYISIAPGEVITGGISSVGG